MGLIRFGGMRTFAKVDTMARMAPETRRAGPGAASMTTVGGAYGTARTRKQPSGAVTPPASPGSGGSLDGAPPTHVDHRREALP